MKSFERFQKWSAAKQSAEVKILSSSFSCVATIKSNISRSLEWEISSSAELLTVVVQETTQSTIDSDESTSAVSGSLLLMAATPTSDGTKCASTTDEQMMFHFPSPCLFLFHLPNFLCHTLRVMTKLVIFMLGYLFGQCLYICMTFFHHICAHCWSSTFPEHAK